jgi:uncharacterized protein YegL
MKKDFSTIAVILDASGSMEGLKTDTIGNFNNFLKEQQAVPGTATFTLCTFSDEPTIVHDFINLAEVPLLDTSSYRTHGQTALLDAMGTTVDSLGKKLDALSEDEKPSKVILVVITDGFENNSYLYSAQQIKEKIQHQQSKYNWQVMFFGAGLDQIAVAQSYGIGKQQTLSYVPTSAGTQQLYSTISSNVTRSRVSS